MKYKIEDAGGKVVEIDGDKKCMYCMHAMVCRFMPTLQHGHFGLPYPVLDSTKVHVLYVALANCCQMYEEWDRLDKKGIGSAIKPRGDK